MMNMNEQDIMKCNVGIFSILARGLVLLWFVSGSASHLKWTNITNPSHSNQADAGRLKMSFRLLLR